MSEAARSRKNLVLVVDDSTDLLLLHRLVLASENYEVITAESAESALRILGTIRPPDLILLDVQMPTMDGLEFLVQLESENPQVLDVTPVVFLSGRDEAPKSRAVGFIRKTGTLEDFLLKVAEFIRKGKTQSLSAFDEKKASGEIRNFF